MQGEQITFIGNRWGSSKSLAVAAVVCALGITAVVLGYTLAGIILLLAAAAPATTSMRTALFPRSRYLRLDANGFEVGMRNNRDRIKWDEVAEFRWGPHNDGPVIEVLYVAESANRQSCSVGDQRFAGRIFDRYDAPLTDVLEKLREWQQRYGHATTPSIGHTTTPSIGHTTTPSTQRRTA
jgi:hypothetical protein